MTFYTVVKYIHVVIAIVALGANITYAVWFSRANRSPEALVFTLKSVKAIDDYIATPAYVLLFPSGWLLASLADWSLTVPWILASLILYAVVSIVGLGIYSPTLNRQIVTAERVGSNAGEYTTIAFRTNTLGLGLNVLVLIIVYLMVAKPLLWG